VYNSTLCLKKDLPLHFVSVTAAKVVEMSRKDSSTLYRLAYFDKCTLHGTDIFFSSKVGLFTQSHFKSHFNRKSTSSRLQVGFGPSQVGFTKQSHCQVWLFETKCHFHFFASKSRQHLLMLAAPTLWSGQPLL